MRHYIDKHIQSSKLFVDFETYAYSMHFYRKIGTNLFSLA